ncbi:histone acetylation protein-domain-containing protein [Tribonema minus]|uniref:histone acetyltransferase n=1 Tax=Tribonema minus TaxID=303371 RepID=A0A836CDY7_9STRA|nr:histone acetylation protein-domain-containing protein [Tribonema minus]
MAVARLKSTLSGTAGALLDVFSAEKLPRSDVSDYHDVEQRVQSVLPPGAPPVVMRLVSNCHSAVSIPAPFQHTFCAAPGNNPRKRMLYTSKALSLFQLIDGAWVMSFMVYAHEYGHDAPACNRGRVYVSYLDSVPFLQPYSSRSAAYQMKLVAYFDWVRRRGFGTVHLCSAPSGDDGRYVFWCHPEHHRTRNEDGLRAWYCEVAKQCQSHGIIAASSGLYECGHREEQPALASDDSSRGTTSDERPVLPPIFKGDFWIADL